MFIGMSPKSTAPHHQSIGNVIEEINSLQGIVQAVTVDEVLLAEEDDRESSHMLFAFS